MRKAMKSLLCMLAVIVLCFSSVSVTLGTAVVSYAAESESSGDEMVLLTQKWLNQQYGDVKGFGKVTENGKSGWDTVYGLLRALQYELGITELANSFGAATTERYAQSLLKRQDGITDQKFAILQGALWCKGYNPGYHLYEKTDGTVVFDAVFDANVEKAVIALKKDAGLINPDGVVTVNVMKALLSMDSFKLLSSYGGSTAVREIQQMLNRNYEEYTGLNPCDGIYGRNTNKALIYALQAEEGMPKNVANGNFGTGTKLCCPEIPYVKNSAAALTYPGTAAGSYYTDSAITSFTKLLQSALLVNGFDSGKIDGSFDGDVQKAVSSFQKKHALAVTGKADKATWMSLLTSCGDTSRTAIAADCATILTAQKAKTLYDNGYRYIGRYLTGTYNGGVSKAITGQEAQIIFDAGLNFFPIYQTSARLDSYFTVSQAQTDANSAIEAALQLGIPADTIIYFAVDFDANDSQINSNVLPYFQRVSEIMNKSIYRTGIYGTRNVCISASAKGYTCSSFVSDMSTGFSGNLGFPLPDDWAFDQFATVSLGSGDGFIEIDKNGFSGRDYGVSKLNEPHRHSYISKTTKAATYTAAGVMTYTCFCGDSYTETIAKLTLAKVKGLKVKTQKASSIKIAWNKVSGADAYIVYYSANGKKWTKKTVTKNTLTVKKLKSGTKYKFKVVAVAGGTKGEQSQVLTTATKPAKETLSSVKSTKKKQAVVTWKTVKGANGYQVTYSTSKKFTNKTTKNVTVKKQKTKKTTLKKLKSGKKYFVKVRAYKTVNGKKLYGAYSKAISVKVK